MPFKCYMVQFAGSFDFITENVLGGRCHLDGVLNNVACTYVSAIMDESMSDIDAFLYNAHILDHYNRKMATLQVLVLRCVKETAAALFGAKPR